MTDKPLFCSTNGLHFIGKDDSVCACGQLVCIHSKAEAIADGEIQRLRDQRDLLQTQFDRAESAVAECRRLQEDYDRVHRLPEQEWASVCAVVLQVLASAAKAGYPVRESDAVKAMDRGQVYVTRLRGAKDDAEASLVRLREQVREKDQQIQELLTRVGDSQYWAQPATARDGQNNSTKHK